MPTYEYRCENCGHELEIFQSITESPRRKCPRCGTHKLRRLIGTGGGVLFRGSGFYQTDYRSESYKKSAEAEKPAEKKKDEKPKEAGGGGKEGGAKKPEDGALRS